MDRPALKLAIVDSSCSCRAQLCHRLASPSVYAAPFESIADLVSSSSDWHCIILRDEDVLIDAFLDEITIFDGEMPIAISQNDPHLALAPGRFRTGVSLYFDQNTPQLEIEDQIRSIARPVRPMAEDRLLRRSFGKPQDALTMREMDVMRFISTGHTSKAIARQLNISHRTVDAHRSKILKKLRSPRIADAVRKTAAALG